MRADKAKRLGLVDLLVEPLGRWGSGEGGGTGQGRKGCYVLLVNMCIDYGGNEKKFSQFHSTPFHST